MRIKYPRTFHCPWSESKTSDDKTLKSMSHFHGKRVVVTEKMDGENTTIYSDYIHARSLDSKFHPSRSWVRALQARIGHLMQPDTRICGENVFATHSIEYTDLESYFYMFSLWNGNVCQDWETTKMTADKLGLTMVPVLYEGIYDESLIKSLTNYREGYVIRLTDSFTYDNFGTSVAKFVRANHVQTDEHWMHSEMKVNILKKDIII